MSLLVGVGLMAASILLFSAIYRQTHRPVPARWTENFYLMSLVCVLFSCGLPAGFGLTVMALVQGTSQGVLMLAWELPVAALGLLGSVMLARRALATAPMAPAPLVPFTPRPRPVAPTRRAA